MRCSIRAVTAVAAAATWLWSLPGVGFAEGASSGAVTSASQARTAFANAGYQVGESHTWSWTQPPFTSFRVTDPATDRVLTVVIYPSTNDADTARIEAARTQLGDPGGVDEPRLVSGFGPSVWTANVALVQSTESRLDRIGTNAGMYDNVGSGLQPVVDTVDLDFQQALINGVANL